MKVGCYDYPKIYELDCRYLIIEVRTEENVPSYNIGYKTNMILYII